jgi:hypothetical protein
MLGDYGILATSRGDLLRAVRINSAADKLARTGGAALGSLGTRITAIMPDISSLDPADVEVASAEGERMTVDQAVAYALGRGEYQ